jgi:hypothetical protein
MLLHVRVKPGKNRVRRFESIRTSATTWCAKLRVPGAKLIWAGRSARPVAGIQKHQVIGGQLDGLATERQSGSTGINA